MINQVYTFDPAKFRLGLLCKKGHAWQGTNQSLKRKYKNVEFCIECRRLQRNKYRAELVSQGLTTRGTVPVRDSELQKAIKNAGKLPSVARLVMLEQRRYWQENPVARAEHKRQWARQSWWLMYQINKNMRFYVRQKSKRRKAAIRDQTAHQIKPIQLRARFAQFDNRCAYCEATGDLHIEHVVPISKGGTHAMGNIIPACKACNFSKRNKEVEEWYRQQAFFTEKRWARICAVLAWQKSSVGQLALL